MFFILRTFLNESLACYRTSIKSINVPWLTKTVFSLYLWNQFMYIKEWRWLLVLILKFKLFKTNTWTHINRSRFIWQDFTVLHARRGAGLGMLFHWNVFLFRLSLFMGEVRHALLDGLEWLLVDYLVGKKNLWKFSKTGMVKPTIEQYRLIIWVFNRDFS